MYIYMYINNLNELVCVSNHEIYSIENFDIEMFIIFYDFIWNEHQHSLKSYKMYIQEQVDKLKSCKNTSPIN